jgi:hypothetical protein
VNLNKNLRWRTIPNTNGFYQVSEFGQLRMIDKELCTFNIQNITGNIFKVIPYILKEKNYGDIRIKVPYLHLYTVDGKVTYPVSSIVISAFHGIVDLDHNEIYHLDGNELNNSIDNLILCERDSKSRMIKMYYDDKSECIHLPHNTMKNFHIISEYNLEGFKQNVYVNRKICSRILNIPEHFILSVMQGSKMLEYDGKIFKQGDGPYIINTSMIKERKMVISNSSSLLNRRLVLQYKSDGKLKSIYNNYMEAAEHNKISIHEVKDAIQKKMLLKDCMWIVENNTSIHQHYQSICLNNA